MPRGVARKRKVAAAHKVGRGKLGVTPKSTRRSDLLAATRRTARLSAKKRRRPPVPTGAMPAY